jgi:hypothetical protein
MDWTDGQAGFPPWPGRSWARHAPGSLRTAAEVLGEPFTAALEFPDRVVRPLREPVISATGQRGSRVAHPDGAPLTWWPYGTGHPGSPVVASGVTWGGHGVGWMQFVTTGSGRRTEVPLSLLAPAGTDPYAGLGDRDRARGTAFDMAEAHGQDGAAFPWQAAVSGDVIEIPDGRLAGIRTVLGTMDAGIIVEGPGEDASVYAPAGGRVFIRHPARHPAENGQQAGLMFGLPDTPALNLEDAARQWERDLAGCARPAPAAAAAGPAERAAWAQAARDATAGRSGWAAAAQDSPGLAADPGWRRLAAAMAAAVRVAARAASGLLRPAAGALGAWRRTWTAITGAAGRAAGRAGPPGPGPGGGPEPGPPSAPPRPAARHAAASGAGRPRGNRGDLINVAFPAQAGAVPRAGQHRAAHGARPGARRGPQAAPWRHAAAAAAR